MQVNGAEVWSETDVFEEPESEPSELFINPFACGVNPLDWRELQVKTHIGICAAS